MRQKKSSEVRPSAKRIRLEKIRTQTIHPSISVFDERTLGETVGWREHEKETETESDQKNVPRKRKGGDGKGKGNMGALHGDWIAETYFVYADGTATAGWGLRCMKD